MDVTSLAAHLTQLMRTDARRVRRAGVRRRNLAARMVHAEAEFEHLVPDPVFVMCSVRSGSTLLRSILDTHTQICAPHELHLATMQVGSVKPYALEAWAALGLSPQDLENLLWDRVLHRLLVRSGKRIIVDKTPQNVNAWQRIHEFWPQARYLHLRRHPAAVYASLRAARPDVSAAFHVERVELYVRLLQEAREALPGPTIRYEDLTIQPEATLREVCAYLGVRFQPRMLNYRTGHNRPGLGDWSERIKSRRIQPHEPLPAANDVPAELVIATRDWGY